MHSLRLRLRLNARRLNRGLGQGGLHLEDLAVPAIVITQARAGRGRGLGGDADVHVLGQQTLLVGHVPGVRLLVRGHLGDVERGRLGVSLEHADVDVSGALVHVLGEVPGDHTGGVDGAALVGVGRQDLERVHGLGDVVDDGEGGRLAALLLSGARLHTPDDHMIAGGGAQACGNLPAVLAFPSRHTQGNGERVIQDFGKVVHQLDVDKAGGGVFPLDLDNVAGVVGAVLGRNDDGVLQLGRVAGGAAQGGEDEGKEEEEVHLFLFVVMRTGRRCFVVVGITKVVRVTIYGNPIMIGCRRR